jgi:hypothetical protein
MVGDRMLVPLLRMFLISVRFSTLAVVIISNLAHQPAAKGGLGDFRHMSWVSGFITGNACYLCGISINQIKCPLNLLQLFTDTNRLWFVMCHLFVGQEDEQSVHEGNRFCSRLPPIQKNKYGKVRHIFFSFSLFFMSHWSVGISLLETIMRELWMQLPLNALKSPGRAGKRNPISVDKMYSSQPSSTSLSAKRTHAIDPEVSDHEKCQKVESSLPRRFSKR